MKKDKASGLLAVEPIQLTEEWAEFAEMRKEKRKALTPRAVTITLNVLEQYYPGDLIKQRYALKYSCMQKWTGVFPVPQVVIEAFERIDNGGLPAKLQSSNPFGALLQKELCRNGQTANIDTYDND